MSVREMIRVKFATARSNALFKGFLARADQARQDTHRVEREQRPECKACFYVMPPATKVEGKKCSACQASLDFNDELCARCAAQKGLCRRCGGERGR